MRKVMLLVAAAAAFGLASYATIVGPVAGALLLIALGVFMAVAASGNWNMLAVAAGSIAAFTSGLLRPFSPIVAASVFLALCYAERSWRVRGRDKRALHFGLALIGGALAGAAVLQVAAADWSVRAVGAVVCAVLAALPLLVDADDPLAFSLDANADEVSEPTASHLRDGAELRRTVDEAVLDRQQRRQARKTWESLEKLARARVRLENPATARPTKPVAGRVKKPSVDVTATAVKATATAAEATCASTPTAAHSCSESQSPTDAPVPSEVKVSAQAARGYHADAVVRRVDQRIAEHVQALARMYTAADAAKAAEMSLEDGPLRSVENAGESLEQMSQAFVDEV